MDSYIMKCTNEQYEEYKNYIHNTTIDPYIINMKTHVWVLLYINTEQYQIFKSYGLNITIDSHCS